MLAVFIRKDNEIHFSCLTMCCIKKIWVTALRKSDNGRNGLSRAYIAKNSMSLSIHFGHREDLVV